MDKLYSINEVADKLNLSDKTLRRWEDAGRFAPSRTLGNQRRYSLEDLQILDAIKHNTINSQSDLLSIDQAASLCGVSPVTLTRWEDTGKIHPFITSGNTYYVRQKLVEKLDELKKIYVDPIPTGSDLEGRAQPERSEGRSDPKVDLTVPKVITKLSPLALSSSPTLTPSFDLRYSLVNIAITILLILGYHLLVTSPSSKPASPATGAVQGATTTTLDPRVDDLIAKFQDHLSAEMLKDAAPAPTTTLKVDGSSLISGSSTLPKGKDQVVVENAAITPTSLVTASFTADYSPAKKYWLTQTSGSFTLHTDFPVSGNSPFNYLILETTPTASSAASPAPTINATTSAVLR
jgi:DNA-binding transcriptional MerR regulator